MQLDTLWVQLKGHQPLVGAPAVGLPLQKHPVPNQSPSIGLQGGNDQGKAGRQGPPFHKINL